MLRIGFFGGGDQAMAGLSALAKHFTIAFIRPRFDNDPVRRVDAPLLETENINAAESVAFVRAHKPDLIVSLNERSILGRELLAIPKLGAINLHNGLLPRQGGGGGAYSGIVNGEPPGMTIHFMDEGADTGDIIAQMEFAASDTMTMAECQTMFREATADFLLSAVRQIEAGTVKRTPQAGRPFHYTPAKPEWDELIDWTQPAKHIYDKVRARTPGPRNFYLYENLRHFVLAAELEPLLLPNPVPPGQVIRRDKKRGVLVKTGDTGIWIRRIRVEGFRRDGPIDGPEHIPAHRVSAMLCYNLTKEVHELRKAVAELRRLLHAEPQRSTAHADELTGD